MQRIYQRSDLQLGTSARKWLRRQTFPGNIRELRNLVERTVLVTPHPELTANDFAANYQPMGNSHETITLPEVGHVSLEEMEIEMIRRAMQQYAGNITQVARALGLTRSALYRRLQKYDIPYAS